MTDQPVLPPNKIAFIIDGKVVDVLHTDDRLAAIFLSQATIIDVTEKYENNDPLFNMINWQFDGTNFIPLENTATPTEG